MDTREGMAAGFARYEEDPHLSIAPLGSCT
jgi:hypothetical protein